MHFSNLQLSMPTTQASFKFKDNYINFISYLPVNDKLEMISWIINQSADELKFYNVGKLKIFKTIAIVQYYTNIDFSAKDLENPAQIYDLLITSNLYNEIVEVLPEKELDWIDSTLKDTIHSIYAYQNSVMGILDTVTTDYKDLNFDVEQLQKNISNPENLTLLKDVVTKLG